MLSLETYKIVHLAGVFLVLSSLSSIAMHALNGGSKDHSLRKLGAMAHGIGLLLILLGGFGMIARLGLMGSLPTWIYLKLAIWLLMGGMIAIAYKAKKWGTVIWWLPAVLALLAGSLGILQP